MFSTKTEKLICDVFNPIEDGYLNGKFSICVLQIELTRRCNLNCMHCMQGDAQDVDIPLEYIDRIMEQVGVIYCLGLSGGEITLCPDRFRYVLESAKKHNVIIGRLLITTNGVIKSNEFLMIYNDFMNYVRRPDLSEIRISKDKFHAVSAGFNEEDYENRKLFFENNGKNKVKFQNVERSGIHRVGRAEKVQVFRYDPKLSIQQNSLPHYLRLLSRPYASRFYRPIDFHGKHICNILLTPRGYLRVSDIISHIDADNPKYNNGTVNENLSVILRREGKDLYCQTVRTFLNGMEAIKKT